MHALSLIQINPNLNDYASQTQNETCAFEKEKYLRFVCLSEGSIHTCVAYTGRQLLNTTNVERKYALFVLSTSAFLHPNWRKLSLFLTDVHIPGFGQRQKMIALYFTTRRGNYSSLNFRSLE